MNNQIIEEAAEWFVEFNTEEPDRATKQAFDDWLRRSPEHVHRYLELLPIWEDAGLRLSAESVGADELIALARPGNNVIALENERCAQPKRATDRIRTPRPAATRRFALASSILAAFVLTSLLWSLSSRGQTYATGVGEQRVIQLADGSSIELNTDSQVRVRFGGRQRDVELFYGQALFHVAKDANRPFVVASDHARIRAVGTEFDVYRHSSGTTVTVLEGRVAVLSDQEHNALGAMTTTPVSAGEQFIISAPAFLTESSSPKRTDVAAATAWTNHRLLFDSTPLFLVAAEFNRYNTRRLIVQGQDLSDFNVSGSFSSTDPASLVRFLEAQRGLTVRETNAGIYISKQ
jgi:transmembrane sensor